MELVITIVVTVAVIGIISAFFLIRPRRSRSYGRMADRELREDNFEPAPRPVERPRAPRVTSAGGDSSMTSLLIGILRAVVGLAAVGVLAYVFSSTQDAVKAATSAADITRVYTGGIFKAVITIGIAAAVYIFTKFHH